MTFDPARDAMSGHARADAELLEDAPLVGAAPALDDLDVLEAVTRETGPSTLRFPARPAYDRAVPG